MKQLDLPIEPCSNEDDTLTTPGANEVQKELDEFSIICDDEEYGNENIYHVVMPFWCNVPGGPSCNQK